MDKNGTFVDTDCNEQKSFVCKADYFDFTPGWENFINAVGKMYDCPEGWRRELPFFLYKLDLCV